MTIEATANIDTSPRAWTLDLSQASDAAIVGGKAINLARMIRAGFAVPTGFVVTTHAYRAAINSDRDASSEQEGRRHLRIGEDLARQITARYQAMGEPMVAVRSSATAEDLAHASMAGQYETVLNVGGIEALIEAIEHCWAAIDSPRTNAYLAQHGIAREEVAMAIVVQRQVSADVAGVLFTIDARADNADHMLIEASWGLGEMVVSGQTQPDTITLSRQTGAVVESRIAEKRLRLLPGGAGVEEVPDTDRQRACLSSRDVEALRQTGLAIEREYGCPQDIEWAISDGRLFVLQSRSITTADGLLHATKLREALAARLGARLEQGDGPWVLHNLAETLPLPTPLTWSVLGPFHSATGGFGALYRMVGFAPGGKANESILELVAGRVFMNLSRAPDLFEADFPFAYDADVVKDDPEAGQSPPTLIRGSARDRSRAHRRLAGAERVLDDLVDTADHDYAQQAKAFRAWCADEAARQLDALDADELAACWHERRARVMDVFAPVSLQPTFVAGHLMGKLRSLLAEYIWDASPDALAFALTAGGPSNTTLQADHGLFEIAQGRMTVDDWLAEHGHRCPGEFDLASPRWRERPNDVARMAKLLADGDDPIDRHETTSRRAAEKLEEVRSRMPSRAGNELDQLITALHRYLPFREDGKHDLMRGYALLRDVAMEAGRRLDIGDDVFLLSASEMISSMRTGYAPLALIEQRNREREATKTIDPPHFIDGDALKAIAPRNTNRDADGAAEPIDASGGDLRGDGGEASSHEVDAWRGFGIASGRGHGPVVVLHSPDHAGELPAGYVLVCRSTDPAWTPLFVNAAAVVLECGGSLSHGAIVAREMGIPAVVLPDATRLFVDGDRLSVDGSSGAIRRINEQHPTDDAPPRDEATEPQAIDPNDPHLPHASLPPIVGSRERRAAKLRNVSFAAWSIFIIAFFALPVAWLKGPTMSVLDATLWPIIVATGRVAGVAIIGVGLAVLTLILQRCVTDHARLIEVKRRAKTLRAQARDLPAGPRKQAMLGVASRAQSRIALSAFVPLALLLGPFVVTFIWLAERVDPNLTVASPGETVQVIATVHGDHLEPVTLTPPDGARIANAAPASQHVAPVRAALVELRSQWAVPSDLDPLPWEVRAAARASRQAMLTDLDAFLEGAMEPQQLSWQLITPQSPGVHSLTIESQQTRLALELAVGDATPPQPTLATGDPQSIVDARLVYPTRAAASRIFFRPLASLGWPIDIGWLGVYLLVYIPAMFLAKAALRVP